MAKAAKDAPRKDTTVENKQAKGSQEEPPKQDSSEVSRSGAELTGSQVSVQQIELPEATEAEAVAPAGKLDMLLDMNIPVTVTIGQTEIPVRRLLQLGPGSILKFDKPIDEPADLFLKDAKFAAGDVVVVDGRFAVRIRQITGDPTSREPGASVDPEPADA